MASMNRVYLLGNLTRDPETKQLEGGSTVANMGLAVSRKFQTRDGKDVEDTCFVDVVAWGKQAESCDKYLHKGDPVLIEGSLKYEEWTDKESGKKRNKIKVLAQRVQFLYRAKRREDETGTGPNDEDAGNQPGVEETE